MTSGPLPSEFDRSKLSHWKRFRYRIEALGAQVVATVIPLLPRRVVDSLGLAVGWLGYYLLREQRRVARANLDLAFGNTKSEREKSRIARVSFQSFAATLVNIFWAPRLNRQALEDFVEFDPASFAHVQAIRAQGRPIVFVTLHFGDWELLGLAVGLRNIPLTIVTRTMRNEALENIFGRLRAATGHRIIPRRHAAAKLLKALKRGECIALLIDQHVPAKLGGLWCKFFGVPVLTSPAAAQLALHANAAILGGVARRLPNGRVRIECGTVIDYSQGDSLEQISQRCLDYCEAVIRQAPEQWLWSYRRWRVCPTPSLEGFPYYAKYPQPKLPESPAAAEKKLVPGEGIEPPTKGL